MPDLLPPSRRRSARTLRSLVALLLAASLAATACSTDDGDVATDGSTGGEAPQGSEGWSFTDDLGTTHTLDAVPDTIAAQSVAAGGLWELGIEADAVFGPLRRPDGTPDPSIGLADPAAFDSLGEVDREINLEALAALQPDIIVTAMWSEDRYWGIDDADVAQIQQIAPIVGIRVDNRSLDEPLERFAELAASLGADLETGPAAEARAAFDAASARLRTALADNPDLLVGAVSGSLTEMWVAYPPAFPDLRYFGDLGMTLVEPAEHPTSGGFWETLSWEQADKYPVDLVLADARGGTLEQVLAFIPESARQLPAIDAGQITLWRTVHAYGYGNVAQNLEDMAAAVESASSDVAG